MNCSGSTKPILTEQEAVEHFICTLAENVEHKWPGFYENYRRCIPQILAEAMEPHELCLALIALNLQSLPNLYARAQINRIETKLMEYMRHSGLWGENAVNQVGSYALAFYRELQAMGPGHYPTGAVAWRLHAQWFGAAHDRMASELKQKIMVVTLRAIKECAEFWQQTLADFELVPACHAGPKNP